MKGVRRRTAQRVLRALAGGVVALATTGVLSACSDGGYHPAGPFRPLPQGAPPQVGPPARSPQPAPPAPGQPADPGGQQTTGDPNVLATGLSVPTGLVVLPDGSAIVGERPTGRLVQVFPDHSPPKPLMTLPGIDATGDGGLLGLALSPTFGQDGLIYAYLSTATDNRVVRFPLGGTPNPVLTGIPHGAVHNGGGLLFAADGTLYVGTGDTGNSALAQDPASLAGKVLHIDVFGRPAGNSMIVARGLSDVTALCVGGNQKTYATDEHGDAHDELDAITDGGDYGWPVPGADSIGPVVDFPSPEAGLGGCAAVGSTVFLGALDGQRVYVVSLDRDGRPTGAPEDFLKGQYGRLRTVVLDAQGALWITTSNRDGAGEPGPDDDRVLRIVPPTSSGNSPL